MPHQASAWPRGCIERGSPFSPASVLGDRISVTPVTHHELKIFPLHTDASDRTWALSDNACVVCGCRAAAGDVGGAGRGGGVSLLPPWLPQVVRRGRDKGTAPTSASLSVL